MRIFQFHLMPWPYVSPEYTGPAWITAPNSMYDPELGQVLYNRYIDELVRCEELGLDGVVINEHHQSAHGQMPSPNLIAAILARATSRIQIGVIGNSLPFYDPPTRIAEEWAMIDVISGGRLIAGMVVGGKPEYFNASLNPTQARDRWREVHDLIMRIWTEDGPFEFIGDYTRLRYVNTWPRPIQKPHPEVWIASTGSLETIDFIAEHRHTMMGIPFFNIDVTERMFKMFRNRCNELGYEPEPEKMGYMVPVYIADTDEQAQREFEQHFWYMQRTLRGSEATPPGYQSLKSMEGMSKAPAGSFISDLTSWDEVIKGRFAIAGSPETVLETLTETLERVGARTALLLLQTGSLDAAMTKRNQERFAAEIMPKLRERFGAAAPVASA